MHCVYMHTEPKKDKKNNEESRKKTENQDAQKKQSSHKVRGVSPEAGSYGGKGRPLKRH